MPLIKSQPHPVACPGRTGSNDAEIGRTISGDLPLEIVGAFGPRDLFKIIGEA